MQFSVKSIKEYTNVDDEDSDGRELYGVELSIGIEEFGGESDVKRT